MRLQPQYVMLDTMKQFQRGELKFDVIDAGPADGPVVVLLHGFPQHAASWSPVIDLLTAKGFRCLAPDQRGYSAAARPRGRRAYQMPELVEDLRALVEASGAGTVHLVGHDWGAAVAWAFAAKYPERLASLSALSVPHPAAMVRAMATIRQGIASWYLYLFQVPSVPEWLMVGTRRHASPLLSRSLIKSGQSAAAARRDADAMAQPDALRAALNWYRAMPLTHPRSVETKIAVPTMFVWSDGDTFVLRTTALRCQAWVTGPYRFEVLRGVSHWMLDEIPADLARLLLSQFAAHPA